MMTARIGCTNRIFSFFSILYSQSFKNQNVRDVIPRGPNRETSMWGDCLGQPCETTGKWEEL